MGKQDRLNWIGRGSPFTLMRPAAKLRDRLKAHGYTVYDIGNQDHLEHEPPEDHTPFSDTGWPGKAKFGIGYAIDIMPPKAGGKSKLTGQPLPSLQRLGAQMVNDRNAGVPGIRWLKYQNWEPERNNGGPCYQDSWKPNHARRSSGDRGHIHQSGTTGFETSTVGDDYDPVARIYGEDNDMPLTKADETVIKRAVHNMLVGKTGVTAGQILDPLRFVPAKLDAILASVADELDVEAINATIREEGEKTRSALTGVRDAILAELPDEGPVSREDVEAAFRTVLGSVDNQG
jgi:hypothetical protein